MADNPSELIRAESVNRLQKRILGGQWRRISTAVTNQCDEQLLCGGVVVIFTNMKTLYMYL